jgi:hypothetical protein
MPLPRRGQTSACIALCSVLLSLAALGCGGKSDASSSGNAATTSSTARTGSTAHSSSTPGTTSTQTTVAAPPPKQFIARADAICHTSNVRLARAKLKSKQPKAVAAAIRTNQKIEEKALAELSKLKPSVELVAAWQKMLGYRRSLASQLGVYATAVGFGVKSFSSLAVSKKALHAKLLHVGHKAGFKDCAQIG